MKSNLRTTSMQDTIEVIKKLANNPVPYVNTGVFLGMTAMDWDLAIKVLLGGVSVVWTILKVINEYKILRSKSETSKRKKNI
jgi:hypothetical protein